MEARKCIHCGAEIGHLRDDARYCSGAHRQAAYRARRVDPAPSHPWRPQSAAPTAARVL